MYASSAPGAVLVQQIFNFGFRQLNAAPLVVILAWYLLAVIAIFLYHRYREQVLMFLKAFQDVFFGRIFFVILAAAMATAVFFLLRSNYINSDAFFFAEKFASDVPAKGAHVVHDEMWELYLHSRFWLYTNHYWGWSVSLSYQVASCFAGSAFIFLLLYYCRWRLCERALPLFLLLVSGGVMQLFFGDIENYTLTTVVILAYYFAALLFLQGKVPLALPAALLSVALTFHLLAGFLIPSLVYLGWIALRGKRFLDAAISVFIFIGIVGWTLWFFNNHNLPIRDLYYRSFAFGYGGQAKTIVRLSWGELISRLNLLALLFPANSLLIILMLFRRIRLNPINIHLIIASGFMLLLFFGWRSGIGIYDDWNLFANCAFVLSILVYYNLLQADFKYKGELLIAFFALSALPTYTWIISNHLIAG
jgi:hypothetical protein